MREVFGTLVISALLLSTGCANSRFCTDMAGETTPKTIEKEFGPADRTEFVGLHALLESVVGDFVDDFRDLPPDDFMMYYDDRGKWFRFELTGRFPQWKHYVLVDWGNLN